MLGVKRKDGAGLIAGNLWKVEAETLHEPAGLPLCHARRHLPSVIPDILNRESIHRIFARECVSRPRKSRA